MKAISKVQRYNCHLRGLPRESKGGARCGETARNLLLGLMCMVGKMRGSKSEKKGGDHV
jgi:hypothetical protein